jgi:hypothetical protein
MAKVIRINDAGFIWDVPLEHIARHRATHYAARDKDTTFQEEFDYVMSDEYEGLDWFQNNMNFEDIEKDAKFIQAPEPLTKPRLNTETCECSVVET